MNRPDQLNALNQAMLIELFDAFNDINSTADIRAVVLTGSGDKSFAAGADIGEMTSLSSSQAEALAARGHVTMDTIASCRVPVIAAINGYALGGGLELALACDFIYAADTAVLGLVEVDLGLIPGFGGHARLRERIGTARAKEMIFSTAKLSAQDALACGLVNQVRPADNLLAHTLDIASKIASKAPCAIHSVKTLLNTAPSMDLHAANKMEREAFGEIFTTQDSKEGISAFLEKRKAKFKGC